MLEPLSLQVPPGLSPPPMGPRGRSQPQDTKRNVALGQDPDSQVESFQMPYDLTWPSVAAKGDHGTSQQLLQGSWLAAKTTLRWQQRLLLILTKELNSHDFWMADSTGEPSWAAVFPE